jgi:hypothetical protein
MDQKLNGFCEHGNPALDCVHCKSACAKVRREDVLECAAYPCTGTMSDGCFLTPLRAYFQRKKQK